MTPMLPSRTEAARRGQEIDRIIAAGSYRAPSGRLVELREAIEASIRGTVSYAPGDPISFTRGAHEALHVTTGNDSSLEAARRLVDEGHRPAVLNFASAKNPGGGYRSGARAQEESLCQASTLPACLVGQPMYEYHRDRGDPLYTRWTISSPDVPVVRGADGALLEAPWPCAFLTSPAPNTKALLEQGANRSDEVRSALEAGVRQVLSVAALQGRRALVLGAWGCGAFGNDPSTVAAIFRSALLERFAGVFTRVHFAVLDWSEERRFLGPFEEAFR